MKLNEEAPEQHLAIIVLGGVFLAINLIAAYKASNKEAANNPNSPQQLVTQVVDEDGRISQIATLHQNPNLSWSELIFCRGLKRSTWCSRKDLHPDTVEAEQEGVAVANGPRRQDHVVAYHGPMERHSFFSSRVSIPEQEVSRRYLEVESMKGPDGQELPAPGQPGAE